MEGRKWHVGKKPELIWKPDNLDSTNGFRLDGGGFNDLSGTSVIGAGDVNDDGFDDLIIGAHWADLDSVRDEGSSYVVFGRSDFSDGGSNVTEGTAGDDILKGTPGTDIFEADKGNDTLIGPGGTDVFHADAVK